jgi:tetratricopeptide (TPR) repeat protein
MTIAIAWLALAVDLMSLWHQATRDTNSFAASNRGVRQYQEKQDAAAVQSFARAYSLRHDAANAFNLGTAQVSAGKHEEGSASLTEAAKEPRFKADGLYNRGTSALRANAFDRAIRDYEDVLRLRPSDAQAKRNLEIAQFRKKQAEKARAGQRPNQQGAQPDEKKKPNSPQTEAQSGKDRGETDAESLLRSVQEQEREELQRMKRARGTVRRVGW